jgi:hypothetical protein
VSKLMERIRAKLAEYLRADEALQAAILAQNRLSARPWWFGQPVQKLCWIVDAALAAS